MLTTRLCNIAFCYLSLIGLCLTGAMVCGQETMQQREFFEQRIRPVLVEQCYECHNSSGKAEGGLAVDHRAVLLKGGEQGALIVAGNPGESRLLKVLRHEIEGLEMPQGSPRLSPRIVADFEQWIRDGAFDPRDQAPTAEEIAAATSWETILEKRKQWWSFQPIAQPAVPTVNFANWSTQPIDQFLLAKMEAHGLQPNAEADRGTLIRRLSFVLTGLPPTPAEVNSFVTDPDSAAYEKLVDRLLASPRFGEHWARHWMDWLRYAETHGSEGDPTIPYAWRYRDYLIRALNADVPYDQLVREHLAGDLLSRPRLNAELGINESILGTAHYRFVQHGFAPTDALDEKVRFTDNQIDVISKCFLGLTVSCARCHNHKFDAISQTDFYALYGIMTSCRPALVTIDTPERQALHREELLQLKQTVRQQLAAAWMQHVNGTPMTAETWIQATNVAQEPHNPLHVWKELKELNNEQFAAGWSRLVREFEESQQRVNARQDRWKLSNEQDAATWHQHGVGMWQPLPTRAGGFHVQHEGETVLDGIYPGGLYSHQVSTKHNGVLGSPNFSFNMQKIFVRVLGDGGAKARYVVQNYPRGGTVYPIQALTGGEFRWVQWDVSYWQGDAGHLEISTAADQAVESNSGQDRSWFGATEVLFLNAGEPAPREEVAEYLSPLFTLPAPASPEELQARYLTALTHCITAFGADLMTDEQALFLRHFVRQGLLPTQLAQLPELQAVVGRYRQLEAEIPVPTRAPGILEADAKDQPLFVRGDHKQPSELVPRRFLEALDATPYQVDHSGRLALAESLLEERNPLVARVIVNRLWHHVFGAGLVATPDNFGSLGQLPTHAELLDWLATRFTETTDQQAYSLKQMIRTLVLTQAFRTSSVPSDLATAQDPDNQWLSHSTVRRLEAESIRDALLATSGTLDFASFGPPVEESSTRRSVYVSQRRNNMPGLLAVFDEPVPFSTVGRRSVTNVPGQSLALLNHPLIIGLAEQWADRTLANSTALTDAERIELMFFAAFGRHPAESELQQLLAYLAETTAAHAETRQAVTKVQGDIATVQQELEALLKPVRDRILTARSTATGAESGTGAIGPTPLAAWEFDGDAHDALGPLHGTLHGDAKIEGGTLVLSGNGYLQTAPLGKELREKTLEVWVQLSHLEQRAGGVMTVQTGDGATFDSIVFAEQAARQWLAGSNFFSRTQPFNGANEETAQQQPVCIAISYASDGTVTAYRNGQLYGTTYRTSEPVTFGAGNSVVLFGLRHSPPGGNRFLNGRIFKARLYDRVLTAAEAATSATGDPHYISPEELQQNLTEREAQLRTELQHQLQAKLLELQHYPSNALDTHPQQAWRDLALTLFNLKEFLYLR